jgi:hypothetical protein
MEESYIDHPIEEALERFLLHHCDEPELEVIETHILACESCVSRLEVLDSDIAASKLALRQFQAQQAAQAARARAWREWLTIPKLLGAGAVAALALGVILVPRLPQHAGAVPEISLSAYRGLETVVWPENQPVHVRLNASDLAEGPVIVQMVDSSGSQIWRSAATAKQHAVSITVPRITEPGTHYLRLYTAPRGTTQGDLLREFAFQVK